MITVLCSLFYLLFLLFWWCAPTALKQLILTLKYPGLLSRICLRLQLSLLLHPLFIYSLKFKFAIKLPSFQMVFWSHYTCTEVHVHTHTHVSNFNKNVKVKQRIFCVFFVVVVQFFFLNTLLQLRHSSQTHYVG